MSSGFSSRCGAASSGLFGSETLLQTDRESSEGGNFLIDNDNSLSFFGQVKYRTFKIDCIQAHNDRPQADGHFQSDLPQHVDHLRRRRHATGLNDQSIHPVSLVRAAIAALSVQRDLVPFELEARRR